MICLVKNKFKQVLYEDDINKHEKLNEKINQQIQDIKQVKTQFLRIHFSVNYINFYTLLNKTN